MSQQLKQQIENDLRKQINSAGQDYGIQVDEFKEWGQDKGKTYACFKAIDGRCLKMIDTGDDLEFYELDKD